MTLVRRSGPVIACTVLILATGVAITGCAAARSRPGSAPSRDNLLDFLARSPDAKAIEEAARAEGLLGGTDSEIEDLEIVMEALDIADIDTLSRSVAEVTDDTAVLFAALDERRRGSRTGDVAHWVSVALLALDTADPSAPLLHERIGWQADYLDDVLDLRRAHQAGELEQAALADTEREPEPYTIALTPRLSDAARPRFTAAEDRGFWPVFSSPGALAIAGTIPLVRREAVAWDELRVLVRRPGAATVLSVPAQEPERFSLAEDGTLTPTGAAALQEGQELAILAAFPGLQTLVQAESGHVIALPWDVNCCQLVRAAEADWWVRLASGPAAGRWLLASADVFRTSHPALQALRSEQRSRRPPRLRLGPLPRAGTVDVYGGARLPYWLAGSAGGPPLFVLGSGPGWSSRYLIAPLTGSLGASHLMLLYDRRGDGYAQGGDDASLLTLEQAIVDLDRVRRASELDRIDILAHGFGALVAIRYAGAYPAHVASLVLVEPEPVTRQGWVAARERAAARRSPADAERMEEIAAAPDWENDPAIVSAWFAAHVRAYLSESAPARIEMPFDSLTIDNFRDTPSVARQALGDWDLRNDLALVKARTLVVSGADSVFLPAAEEIASGIAGALWESIDNAGHFPFSEAEDRFADLVTVFLAR